MHCDHIQRFGQKYLNHIWSITNSLGHPKWGRSDPTRPWMSLDIYQWPKEMLCINTYHIIPNLNRLKVNFGFEYISTVYHTISILMLCRICICLCICICICICIRICILGVFSHQTSEASIRGLPVAPAEPHWSPLASPPEAVRVRFDDGPEPSNPLDPLDPLDGELEKKFAKLLKTLRERLWDFHGWLVGGFRFVG